MNEHDLVIRNGTIIDGSGADRFVGDVAVTGGVITHVGDVEGSGAREVDATGHIVFPGFVDIHTHYDGQATWDQQLAPSSWHGVTTVVAGNCGVGFAPVTPEALREALRRAVRAFAEPKLWERMQNRGMKADVSWDRSALRYASLYAELLVSKSKKP